MTRHPTSAFYEVLEKLGVVIGMFSWGYIEGLTGSMRNSLLVLIGFFVVALITLLAIPQKAVIRLSPLRST